MVHQCTCGSVEYSTSRCLRLTGVSVAVVLFTYSIYMMNHWAKPTEMWLLNKKHKGLFWNSWKQRSFSSPFLINKPCLIQCNSSRNVGLIGSSYSVKPPTLRDLRFVCLRGLFSSLLECDPDCLLNGWPALWDTLGSRRWQVFLCMLSGFVSHLLSCQTRRNTSKREATECMR